VIFKARQQTIADSKLYWPNKAYRGHLLWP